jgi:NitT/TauT family transport system substrate-binding protein
MKKEKLQWTSLGVLLLLSLAVVAGCRQAAAPTAAPKLDRLTLVGPAGPMAIPLAYLAENDKLADIATETELVIWENPDQLRAIVSGGQEAHFLTLPSNSAATFYNKGMQLQMLDISVWGILYVVSDDPNIKTVADLKGQEVVVPFKGNMPDLLFNYVCQKQGIDITSDLTVYYANSPQQAAQLLLSGQKSISVLTEPLTTQVLLKSKAADVSLYRSIDIQAEWSKASGLGERIPIAGTVALPAIQENPEAIKRFMQEYKLAVEWIKANPDQAGVLGSEIEQLGFEAPAVAESLKNTKWDFVQVKDCQADIEAFFMAFSELNPAVIGGQMPDTGLYYEGIEIE